jgi:hypothetical protein
MQKTDYTPVSSTAVASAVCAALSVGGYLFPLLAMAALPAIVFGIIALVEIRKYGHIGRRLVTVGLPLSLTIAVGTAVLEAALYRSESPDGYRRVDFARNLDEYVGERICLKGYGPWDGSGESQFSLSFNGSYRDMKNVVIVELANGDTWESELNGVAVSGRLERWPSIDDAEGLPRYILKDAVLRPSRTVYQLAPRSLADGC